MAKKAVLAYSGGLDTSVAIRWMQEHYGCEVVACAVDVGQEGADLEAVLVGHAAEPLQVLPERQMVGVLGVVLHHGHHGVGIDEPGQVIDVTVRVIPHDSVAEPQNVGHLEVIA